MARPKALAALPDEPSLSTEPVAPPANLHELQAAAEGVTPSDRVEMFGEWYRVGDKVGLMPLMRFAHFADAGMKSDDMRGLAAMYDIFADCIHADDWDRFQADAIAKKADSDDLLRVVQQAISLISARPTQRPSDSSGGPTPTSPSSTESSPSPETPTGSVTEKVYRIEDLIADAAKKGA